MRASSASAAFIARPPDEHRDDHGEEAGGEGNRCAAREAPQTAGAPLGCEAERLRRAPGAVRRVNRQRGERDQRKRRSRRGRGTARPRCGGPRAARSSGARCPRSGWRGARARTPRAASPDASMARAAKRSGPLSRLRDGQALRGRPRRAPARRELERDHHVRAERRQPATPAPTRAGPARRAARARRRRCARRPRRSAGSRACAPARTPSSTRPLAALMAFFPTLDRPSSRSLDMRRTSRDQSYGIVHSATTLIK